MREYGRKTEIFKDKPEKIKSFWDLLGQIAVFWEIFLQKTIAFFRKFCYNNADSIKGDGFVPFRAIHFISKGVLMWNEQHADQVEIDREIL